MRGAVRAEGWAEAEKAKAQRKSEAERERRRILGHTPRSGRQKLPTIASRAWVYYMVCPT